jgi:hypothetical protein
MTTAVNIGAPTAQNVARATVEAAGYTTLSGLAAAAVRPDWYPIFSVALVATSVVAWVVVSLTYQSVAVSSESLHAQSWLQILRRKRGQTLHVSQGQRLCKMPDGLWQTDGATLPLNVPHWEGRRLKEALTEAGFVVEDRRSEWTRDHRGHFWGYRLSWTAFLVGIWGNIAFQPSLWQLPCLALMLAGLAGWLVLKPPRTSGPILAWSPTRRGPQS